MNLPTVAWPDRVGLMELDKYQDGRSAKVTNPNTYRARRRLALLMWPTRHHYSIPANKIFKQRFIRKAEERQTARNFARHGLQWRM